MSGPRDATGFECVCDCARQICLKKSHAYGEPALTLGRFLSLFEVPLISSGFMTYGAPLVGQPELNIAFNQHLGWTLTVNTIDAADRYELTLQDGGYVLDGVKQAFETKFHIRQPDGQLKPQSVTCRYSIHGPIMATKDGKTYAFRLAGLTNPAITTLHYAMAKAKNLAEFETALQRMKVPMFNVIYADVAGNKPIFNRS